MALATQNSALAAIVEKMWIQRTHNPYWKKLHEHIDTRTVDNWCGDHDKILKALIRKDPNAAKLAMWQHLENTKVMLFNETSDDFEFNADRYLLRKTQWYISIPPPAPASNYSAVNRRSNAPVGLIQ